MSPVEKVITESVALLQEEYDNAKVNRDRNAAGQFWNFVEH